MITAAQIVAQALAIAKAPGYTSYGGQCLNLVLSDLVLHRNLKVNLVSSTIAVPANNNGPFQLETNYLRTYDLFYVITDIPYKLNQCTLQQYDSDPNKTTIANYPYEFATDLSGVPTNGYGVIYIYPQSNMGVTLNHRYFVQQADIATPETSSVIPWFSDQDYLIHATATRMMKITDDSRFGEFSAMGESLLEKHLLMEGDEQSVVKSVQLDPRRFKVGGSLKPTKVEPF